jgi:hypothetical protein
MATRAASAWVHVCAEGFGGRDDALTVALHTETTALGFTLGANDAVGARPRPEQGGMYRAPVPLEALRNATQASISFSAHLRHALDSSVLGRSHKPANQRWRCHGTKPQRAGTMGH